MAIFCYFEAKKLCTIYPLWHLIKAYRKSRRFNYQRVYTDHGPNISEVYPYAEQIVEISTRTQIQYVSAWQKKKKNSSYIRESRRERLQSHTRLTASS